MGLRSGAKHTARPQEAYPHGLKETQLNAGAAASEAFTTAGTRGRRFISLYEINTPISLLHTVC